MGSCIGRLGRAALATGLALVVLSGPGGTGALWSDAVELEPGGLQAGNVQLTKGNSRVELHSQQPAGSRTYKSTATCTASGYTECRVITETIADEALIPGDRVVITQKATLTAKGTNLQGTFVVDPGNLTSSVLSRFSGSATTVTKVTPPGGTATTSTSFPVVVRTGQGLGEYTLQSTITTTPKNGTADWGSALQGQTLYDGTYTFTFTQTE